MKVVITGGGTGGHLSVAKAFLEELQKREIECIFIGSSGGQDLTYFENEIRFSKKFFLQTSGVVNKKGLGKVKSLFYQALALKEAIRILKKENIGCVISVGGYSAAPASFASVLLKIPLFIHEQNARIGRLNGILKRKATLFFSSYLEPFWAYPTQEDFFTTQRVRKEIKNILFMGGSQGARAINQFALSMAEDINKKGIKIFHQCGKREFENILEEYKKLNLKIKILKKEQDLQEDFEILLFDFCFFMPKIMQTCDFAISRAGASSLWELCANGLPALFVPYPYAAQNHQYFNAKFIQDKELGFLCEEKDLFCDVLWDILELLDSEKLENISTSLMKQSDKNASAKMVDAILRITSN
ncbi:UDP-N-acetylglucosamine--N-acetylmuramyl-(pentapeptide) pyrophosphoryl-undecaprenol N-acetylglucosamine transferase [Helicobacter burdigaliensis]|uniref:UDP-N-acetylglucosamine--N-acetylmuramyl- (pentapeptide) pyrophosphoryl-undecaprenol N-acetylglucosamine transferase n=1 Tax=Helicobacter burdigaliensis TaxID=2315334 RepID=UPI000EF702D7|nr:UDP-N-acetylglucosamine--N-acetylmuramyl-(pentapeptide) pyrophosphoryl-undecaprenol N-acetylglucosamine transferase [Helicobacter burdigaliensis]